MDSLWRFRIHECELIIVFISIVAVLTHPNGGYTNQKAIQCKLVCLIQLSKFQEAFDFIVRYVTMILPHSISLFIIWMIVFSLLLIKTETRKTSPWMYHLRGHIAFIDWIEQKKLWKFLVLQMAMISGWRNYVDKFCIVSNDIVKATTCTGDYNNNNIDT